MLEKIGTWMRDRLLEKYPVTLCCADCGALPRSLAGRLCSSLEFPFDCDLVVLADEKPLPDITWARGTIFVVGAKQPEIPKTVKFIGQDSLIGDSASLPTEARLHRIPELKEHFLVVDAPALERFTPDLSGYFTPNGIPLLQQTTKDQCALPFGLDEYFAARGFTPEPSLSPAPDAYGWTKTASMHCADFYKDLSKENLDAVQNSPERWCLLLQQWSYAAQAGILQERERK